MFTIKFLIGVIGHEKLCFPKDYRNPRHSGETLIGHSSVAPFPALRKKYTVLHARAISPCMRVSVYSRVETQRERERKRERRKKRGVGYTTAVSPRGIRVLDSHPRLRPSPPLSSLPPVSLYLSLFSAVPPPPFGLVLHRESRQRCVPWLTRGEKGRGGNPGGSWGKRWLHHKPAIPARMTGDYVIQRDVRVLVCTGSRARSFIRSFVRSLVPRVFHVTPDSRMSHGLPALIHPIKFNFKRPARRSTLPAHSSPRGKIDPLNGTD